MEQDPVCGEVRQLHRDPIVRIDGGQGRDPQQQVPHVTYAGVCEQALDVVLHQCAQVAQGHRQGSHDHQNELPVGCGRHQCLGEKPQDQGEGCRLGADRQVCSNRSRRSLVGVWGPHVKGHGGDLKPEARDDEHQAHHQPWAHFRGGRQNLA